MAFCGDILLKSNSQPHMLQLMKQIHDIASKEKLKLATEKSIFTPLAVKYFGHEIGVNTFKLIQSKSAAIYKFPP